MQHRLHVAALLAVGMIAAPREAVGQVRGTIGFWPPEKVEAQPGSALRAAVIVSNQGTAPIRLTPRVQLPLGWQPLLTPDAFEVPSRTTNLFILNAIVPRGTIAGTYPIVVDLESNRGERRRDTVHVTVLARRALRVVDANGPRYARLDSSVTVDFVVRNEGNVNMSVELRARAVNASASVRDSSRLIMSAGDVRYVAVVVGPARAGGNQLVELEARAAGGVASGTGKFEVLRVAEGVTGRTVMPLTVRLRAASGEVTPAEISGAMTGRRDTFDLLVRQPGQIGSLFGERDEYRLRWSGARGRLHAGDIVPSGGVIRDSYEMLTGFDAALRVGPVTASAYAGKDRLFQTDIAERGAALSVRPFGSLDIGVGALQRVGGDSTISDGRAWRAFTNLGGTNFGAAQLRGEVSGGVGGISAYGVRAHARSSRAWLDASAADLTADHPVRERGTSRASVGVGARLTRLLSIRAWGGQYTMDTLAIRDFSYQSQSYSAGFSFGPLSAEVRQEERDAFIQGSSYSSREESARATVGGAFRALTLTAGAELGKSHDARFSAAVTPFQRFTGSVYLNGNSRWTGGFSVEYYSREGLQSNQQLSGTVTTSAELPTRTRIQLVGSVFHVLFPTIASFSTVDARVEQPVWRTGHTIALRTRAFATTAATVISQPTTFFVEYGIPIGIPIPGIGPRSVRARVIEAGSGRVVPGALVRMGEYAAITGRDGRVTFAPTATLGVISVERSNASSPLVIDAPELSAVAKGRQNEFTIRVGEGARVTGRVSRYDRVTRDSVAPVSGIPDVVVIASRGADTLSAVTRDDGTFDFRQLVPGQWSIRVSGGRLPPAYGFERSAASVAVASGRTATLEFRVLMQADEGVLQDGGTLVPPKPEPKSSPKSDKPRPR